MKIYSLINKFNSLRPCVLAIGMFDGVHMGHKKIINNLINESENKYCTVLITFYPHPKEILYPNFNICYLNTFSERINKIQDTGIENLIIQPFNKKFSNLKIQEFLHKITHYKFNIKKMIVGYDFHIGKNREGTIDKLKKNSKNYKFQFLQISPFKLNKEIISSTKIRNSLLLGKIEWANSALGYFYTISGYIKKGYGIGNFLRFPTANIKVNSKKLIPKKGVYAVKIKILESIFNGMMNISINPTINYNKNNISIKVHIFNFFKNIYGKKIDIFIIKIIREDIKFYTFELLKNQIKEDKKIIKKFFKEKKFE